MAVATGTCEAARENSCLLFGDALVHESALLLNY